MSSRWCEDADRVGWVERSPSLRHRIDGFRCALPILRMARSKASEMAVHAPSRVRFAVAVLSATFALHAIAGAAAPVSDGVTLTDSTITWSTVKYATSAENEFVSGSLDKKTIVDRTF